MLAEAIDPNRFLADLAALREFGKQGNGVVRPAFSKADIDSRLWLANKIGDASLNATFDPAGNLFGIPKGDGPFLLIGSHTDSQPEGGWLDGAFGVIAGLELARVAAINGGPGIAVVSFQDEEGRFVGLTGSSIFTSLLSLEDADTFEDSNGISFGQARRQATSICDEAEISPETFSAFIEPHIEQGPILDASGETVGVVENIVGFVNERFQFTGQQNHAGTTPMRLRRDAFQGLVDFVSRINDEFEELAGHATVWTVGEANLHPNADSIIPGKANANLQIRDASQDCLKAMMHAARSIAGQVAAERKLEMMSVPGASKRPVRLDENLKNSLAMAAEQHCPGNWRKLSSGALHDASNLAHLMPTAMLFSPSIGGISHDFAEETHTDDLVTCLEVLASAVDDWAGKTSL